MAIQLPNPGLGDGQTGDNEFVMWTKVKDNFSNTTHAASKTVGVSNDQVPLAQDVPTLSGKLKILPYKAGLEGIGSGMFQTDSASDGPRLVSIDHRIAAVQSFTGSEAGRYAQVYISMPFSTNARKPEMFLRGTVAQSLAVSGWARVYTDANTTKEDRTGYLVASSPVLKVQHDSFEKVHEAEQLDIEVENIKTGVYEITGTTGLREDDGWNLKPPKDVNGNVLCICEASEKDGVITLKTYKKKFDFDTVSIVGDYEQPTNIPEGATVMLRFNDLPQEQLDEPTI